MSQEDVERLDEDDAAVEEQDDETPDTEGHIGAHDRARASDPGAHTGPEKTG